MGLDEEDRRIPDSLFAASSANPDHRTEACDARLNGGNYLWMALHTDVDPWLQVDLIFVRLVTGFATQGGSANHLNSYSVSFGFHADQLTVYLDAFRQRRVSITGKFVLDKSFCKMFVFY